MKKKLSALTFSLLASIVAFAQQHGEDITDEMEQEPSSFTSETKWALIAIWTVVIIILVLRTFRNKADV